MSVFGRASMVVSALAGAGLALVMATGPDDLKAAAPAIAGMRSAGAMAFGPDGVLFVGDSRAGAVHALAIEEAQPDPATGDVKVDHVDRKIAALLGTTVEDIAIHDMAVHPRTRAVYFSVSKGRGDTGTPVLVRSTLAGQMSIVTPRASGSRLDLLDAPAEDAKTPWGERSRTMTVTDLAFADGELLVAGLSNEAFASTLRRVAYPFTAKAVATTLEIYHTSHGRYETAAPIETFLPFAVKGKPALLAGYGCAPLAAFELSALRGAKHLRGVTLAELGGGNRPHDMVAIERDGKKHVIVANSDRTLMRITAADIDRSDPLTRQSTEMYESFGTPYISLAIVGVLQLDRLGSDAILMLQRDVEDGSLDLRSRPTKYL